MWHGKGTRITKMVLTKHKVPDVKTYYIAIVIKTVWYRWRDRHMHVPRLGVELELKHHSRSHSPGNTRPLTCCSKPGIKLASSGILVGFLTH